MLIQKGWNTSKCRFDTYSNFTSATRLARLFPRSPNLRNLQTQRNCQELRLALAQHSAFCAEKELELSLGRGEPFTMGARKNRPNTRHLMTKGVTTRNIYTVYTMYIPNTRKPPTGNRLEFRWFHHLSRAIKAPRLCSLGFQLDPRVWMEELIL